MSTVQVRYLDEPSADLTARIALQIARGFGPADDWRTCYDFSGDCMILAHPRRGTFKITRESVFDECWATELVRWLAAANPVSGDPDARPQAMTPYPLPQHIRPDQAADDLLAKAAKPQRHKATPLANYGVKDLANLMMPGFRLMVADRGMTAKAARDEVVRYGVLVGNPLAQAAADLCLAAWATDPYNPAVTAKPAPSCDRHPAVPGITGPRAPGRV